MSQAILAAYERLASSLFNFGINEQQHPEILANLEQLKAELNGLKPAQVSLGVCDGCAYLHRERNACWHEDGEIDAPRLRPDGCVLFFARGAA